MTILAAINKVAKNAGDVAALAEFISEIEHIMSPFQPGTVQVRIESAIAEPWKIRVDIEHLGKFVFPIDPFVQNDRPYVLEQIAEIWRELYVEPEDHIQLGLE